MKRHFNGNFLAISMLFFFSIAVFSLHNFSYLKCCQAWFNSVTVLSIHLYNNASDSHCANMMCKIAIYLEDWFCYVDLSFTLYDKVSRALPDMTSAPLKAPINWTASITLIGFNSCRNHNPDLCVLL